MTRKKEPGPKGRRGHNDGSIYQRESDGRWVAAVTHANGARQYLYGRTREEVRRKLLHAQSDHERGVPFSAGSVTLERYLGEWLEARRPSLDERTARSYSQFVRLYLTPTLGRIRLSALTALDIERMYAEMLASGRATGTVRVAHAVLRKALEDAVRHDRLVRNVAKLVTLPKNVTREIHPLTAEQVATLLDATRDHRLHALFTLAIFSGMRISELLGLRWSDVSLEGPHPPVVRVRYQLKRLENGQWAFAAPKTKKGRRQIRLAPLALAALHEQRARLATERLALARAWQDYDLVFPAEGGRPAWSVGVNKILKRVLRRAGLPEIRFHDLRHTCATLLLAGRVNPKVVSEMLGHSSVGLTLDIYSHVLPDMQDDAVDVLADVLDRARARRDDHAASAAAVEGGNQ